MRSAWELPSTLTVGGLNFNIRTDFRAVIDIITALSNPEYESDEKILIMLMILFEDFDSLPTELYDEAIAAACDFIDMSIPQSRKNRPSVMNWEQDAPIIISAVNGVIGYDVRSAEHMHWWTFLSAYMGIGESLFSTVLNIRQKRASGKKLEKHEKDFINENRHLIDVQLSNDAEAREEKDNIIKFLDGD